MVATTNVKHLDMLVVHQFEFTPKAFANVSPELERSDNSGIAIKIKLTPKGFAA